MIFLPIRTFSLLCDLSSKLTSALIDLPATLILALTLGLNLPLLAEACLILTTPIIGPNFAFAATLKSIDVPLAPVSNLATAVVFFFRII